MALKTLKTSLLLTFALFIANAVHAEVDGSAQLSQRSDTPDTMVWPMLPNESLSQLAAKFYPHNKSMQREFIAKTKRLNKIKLNGSTSHKNLTAITIPNLKSLSVKAGRIKRAQKKALNLSYNIEPADISSLSFSKIPERLVKQYKTLLERNTFLKVEIDKLNKRLVFLENKLGQLTLILDRTLSLPAPKRKLKNLDAEKQTTKPLQIELVKKPTIEPTKKQETAMSRFFDLSNKWLWAALGLFALLVVGGSYLGRKRKDKSFNSLIKTISQQNPVNTMAEAGHIEDALFQNEPLGHHTVVEEEADDSAVQEAKVLMSKGSPDEAIAHLKWTIRANPRASIKPWLYLLDIFRQQNAKDEFEKYASEMHENFNAMTPIWTQGSVDVVVAQSLEEFSYITDKLTDDWPNEKLINYLKKLVLDNRSGQRSGFSKAVIAEILLLIDVLEIREPD